MIIGIISDLHLDNWKKPFDFHPNDYPSVDIWINAGDTSSNKLTRDSFDSLFKDKTYLRILGNHDYYGMDMETSMDYNYAMPDHFCAKLIVDDIKIAGATLWTDLSNPIDWLNYKTGLIDCSHIKNWRQEIYYDHHEFQLDFLLNSEADIIVSHHAPSYQSVGPRYKGDPYNPCFATELSGKILSMKKPPKLWIHGHMHNESDYMIDTTRVICHPRGYPGEINREYKPLFLKV